MTRTLTTTVTAVGASAAAVLALAGCTYSISDPPAKFSTCTTCGTAAPGSAGGTATAGSSSTLLDAAAQEKKDRADAEAVWFKFDTLGTTMQSLPADQVTPALTAVAVDPALSRMQAQNTQFRAEGKIGYGTDILYVSWPKLIAGGNTAVINDCQDQSQAGYKDAKTGNKLTVGTKNTPIQVTLTRSPQGWKVADANLVAGGTCTPGTPW